jgi:hypothetical protein
VAQVPQNSTAPADGTGTPLSFVTSGGGGFYNGGASPPASLVTTGPDTGEAHVGPGLYQVSGVAQFFDLDNPS